MKEDVAYWVPLVVALVIAVFGVVTIVGDSDVLNPKSTTTVTTGATAAVLGGQKKTTEVTEENGTTKTVTTTEDQPQTPAQPQKTVTTTEAGERSFLERVLGDGGLVVLQIGAVLLAAFLAAAIFQRVILARYEIKIGSLELPAIAVDTADALEGLDTKIDELDQERREGAADVREHLAVLYKRLDLIEKQIEP